MGKKFLLCMLFLAILVPNLLFSGTTGKIAGIARDAETGQALVGVNIQIIDTRMGAATDLQGEYFIINIQPGKYTVKATMMGYATIIVENITIIPDLTTTINFDLKTEAIQGESVTIVAERPVIQRDVTFSSTITTADEIENMPVNQIADILNQSAGVIADDGGGMHIRGGRTNEIGYMVDGFAVNDPFTGGVASDVVNTGIQNFNVIAGTFNAEYGQAMSGIVNIVTKEGSNKYSGTFRASSDQFGVDRYNNGTTRLEGSLSGPVPFLKDKASFFISADNLDTKGYLNESTSYTHDLDGNPVTRHHNMNLYQERRRITGKFVIRPTSNLKLSFGANLVKGEQRFYSKAYRIIPDHVGIDYNDSKLFHFTWSHILSPSTFYELRLSQFTATAKHSLNDDFTQIDPPTPMDNAFDGTSNYEFNGPYIATIVGTDTTWAVSDDNFWSDRKTVTTTVSGFIASQIHKRHYVKLGFEYNTFDTQNDIFSGINERGPGVHTEETHYNYKPYRVSAYIQDKIEYKDFVVNLGIRYDRQDSKASYMSNLGDPLSALAKAPAKAKISPRLGFAHPLTEKVRLHFAYGLFYQFPQLRRLYRRFDFNDDQSVINVTQGYRPRLGNPDLKPETASQYEFGLEQALTDDVSVHATVFYRDIYDYITAKYFDVDPNPYFMMVNMDYANSKGVILSLRKRYSKHYSFEINYTLSRAEGNADDYMTHFNELQNASVTGQIPPKKTVTLGWDKPHNLTFRFDLRYPGNWGLNVIGTFASGSPYTPTDARGKAIGEVNSQRQPATGTIDLRLNKDFKFFGIRQSFYVNVWNVLDKENILMVYRSTGKPDYSDNPNTSEEAMHNPHWYGPPRTIEAGVRFSF
ncbi:TonB-dependent receptor [bacterium]|nr:TonB-dependent receptor [bacterium]